MSDQSCDRKSPSRQIVSREQQKPTLSDILPGRNTCNEICALRE
jgi:hypothetical protein